MITKYTGLDESGHGGELIWPGTEEGYPVRLFPGQSVFPLKDDEYRELDVITDAKVKIFDLSNKDDLDEYEKILDRHHNGWYRILKESEVYDPDTKNWRVKLEWLQFYGQYVNKNRL